MDPNGNEVYSCTIITCQPNELSETYHDRMPVILDASARNTWLADDTSASDLQSLLVPYPAEAMAAAEPVQI